MSQLRTHLPTRKIGGVAVSEIGFGTMGLSAFYGPTPSDEERFKVFDAAIDQGCNYFDTADMYGDSEDLIGKWFKKSGRRKEIFLASKFGFVDGGKSVDGSPEHTKQAIQRSLQRLGVDQIDLYYLHRVDSKVPIEKTVGALADFVKQGKIRFIGLSEASSETIRRAHAVHPIAAVQVEYSPFCLDIENPKIGVLKTCRELGITVVAYSPLGRGLLTGKYRSPDDFSNDDFRKIVPMYSKENFPNILKLVDGLKKIGQKYNATPGQISLAWILAQGPDTIPIPGTKQIKYLKENLDAVKFKLNEAELSEIRHMADKANCLGENRYPPGMQELLFVSTPPIN